MLDLLKMRQMVQEMYKLLMKVWAMNQFMKKKEKGNMSIVMKIIVIKMTSNNKYNNRQNNHNNHNNHKLINNKIINKIKVNIIQEAIIMKMNQKKRKNKNNNLNNSNNKHKLNLNNKHNNNKNKNHSNNSRMNILVVTIMKIMKKNLKVNDFFTLFLKYLKRNNQH